MVCDMDNLPNPDNTDMIMMLEDSFAIFVCQDGYTFRTNSEGVVWCEDTGNWSLYDSSCVLVTTSQTETTSQTTPANDRISTPTTPSPPEPTSTDLFTTEDAQVVTSTTATTTSSSTTPIQTSKSTEDDGRTPSTVMDSTTPEPDSSSFPPSPTPTTPGGATTGHLAFDSTQDNSTPELETHTENWANGTTIAGDAAEGSSSFLSSNLSYVLVGGIVGLLLFILFISILLACRNKSRKLPSMRKREHLGQPDDQNDDASSYNNTYPGDNTLSDPAPFNSPEIVPAPAANGAVQIPPDQRRRFAPSELLPEYVTVIKIHKKNSKNAHSVAPIRAGSLHGYSPTDDQHQASSQISGSKAPSSVSYENESLYNSIVSSRMDGESTRRPSYIGHAPMADLTSGTASLGKSWLDARDSSSQVGSVQSRFT